MAYSILKRLFDLFFSIFSVCILSPVFLILIIIVKLDDPKGKVFFAHKRVGKNGKEIKIYKFRSMVHNAEELIKKFTDEQKKEYYTYFKLENDPRITKVGKFLRKTSLDELPQFINIIKGDLSIVGPRPIVSKELELYGDQKDLFLSVRPGLTGYWAVNGRSSTDYNERIKLELYYVEHCSIALDFKIIFKTFGTVIKCEGAA